MGSTGTVSFESLAEERIARITEACTFCGKCFEVCPMAPYTDLKGADPEAVTRSVIDILNGRPHAPEGALWTQTCQKSGVCIEACPEDVNPREMLAYAKIKLQRAAAPPEEIGRESRDFFQRLSRTIRLMAGLQTDPGVFKRLTAVRGKKKEKAESVFYFGCNILKTPHILLSCMDVFDRMELDYEVAGGVAHCCGINHIRRGDLESGAAMGARSLELFKAFEPKRVITFCPTCQMQYTDFSAMYAAPDEDPLPFVHITQYLAENRERLKSLCVHPVPKRVAVHDHGGIDGVETNVRTVLSCVPGLELVEIDQHADHAYQCPTLLLQPARDVMHEKLFASARAAEVDTVVTVYHGCHRELCAEEGRQPFQIENFMTILGRSMGFSYPDWTKTFMLYEDMDRVLGEAGDLLRANGIDPEKTREQLQAALYG
ncbi:MAG: (Fe-S)-binding protein [bacterium]